jgi:hypothetical protein
MEKSHMNLYTENSGAPTKVRVKTWLKDLGTAFVLLRIPFSIFLSPVYTLALVTTKTVNWEHALAAFVCIHIFIYPASNGINSFYDRDEYSIGGLEAPPKVPPILRIVSEVMDTIGVLTGIVYVNIPFAIGLVAFSLTSRAYSVPWVRLKSDPLLSTLAVALFQGAGIYLTTVVGVSSGGVTHTIEFFLLACMATCLIGASYPLTQIYQIEEDTARGDTTLAIALGPIATLGFSAFLYTIAFGIAGWYSFTFDRPAFFILLASFSAIPAFLIGKLGLSLWKGEKATFRYSHRLNIISSISTNLAFAIYGLFSR